MPVRALHPGGRGAWVLAAALFAAGGAVAYAVSGPIDAPATVAAPAERSDPGRGDVAVAYDVGEVDRFVVEAAGAAAARVGGVAAPSRSGSLGLRALTRGGATVHAPPPGYLIPMAVISLPRGAVGGVMGTDVSAVLTSDTVVMNEMTAGLMGAREGDVVVLRAASGASVSLSVAGIRPYDQIGWAEIVFTTEVADRLGMTTDTRVVMWGFDDRAGLDAALADVGLIGRIDTRVTRSWDPPDPDDTISTARTKVALGEPWYRIEADGSITMHPDWKSRYLTDGRVLLDPVIRIRAQCHRTVAPALSAALAEVAAAGLAAQIDVADANSVGGCYAARYSRTSGFLSRHTYGMALDTNTSSNCMGCRPRIHCDVVRIFRRHGFAWGGNFRRPDGMHFEWVGERRDQIAYPSPYCPNVVAAMSRSAGGVDTAAGADPAAHAEPANGLGVLLAGQAWIEQQHVHEP